MRKDKKKLQEIKTTVLVGIASKTFTPTNLPITLYDETAKALVEGVDKGYGTVISTTFGSVDEDVLKELRENIYIFSGAKTFQQTYEMSQEFRRYEDKEISFKEFNENAGQIFDDYNEAYLESEYNTAINKAITAAKWQNVEKEKDVTPYLRINCVEDELLCDICSEFDGAVYPVESAYADDMIPPFHYNTCRCTFEQLSEEEGKEEAWEDNELDEALNKADKAGRIDLFKNNPGKEREIFKSTGEAKHPYFNVPERYKEFAKQNFGLKM